MGSGLGTRLAERVVINKNNSEEMLTRKALHAGSWYSDSGRPDCYLSLFFNDLGPSKVTQPRESRTVLPYFCFLHPYRLSTEFGAGEVAG